VECHKPITANRVDMEPTSGPPVSIHYHPKCFNCKKCGKNLRPSNYSRHENRPYCEKCILIINPVAKVTGKVKNMGFQFK
jgi:NAD-dependent SIR2 family protein deacetylase